MKPFSLSALLLPAALFLFSCSSPSTKLCERSVEVRMDPSCGYAYELVISLEYPVRGASEEVLAAVRAGIVSSAFGPGFLSGVEDDADEILTAAAFCEAVDAYVDQRSRDYRLDNAPPWEGGRGRLPLSHHSTAASASPHGARRLRSPIPNRWPRQGSLNSCRAHGR